MRGLAASLMLDRAWPLASGNRHHSEQGGVTSRRMRADCALATQAQAQNLISNGGFETLVTVGGSSATLAGGNTVITGWQVVGPNILWLNTGYTKFNVSFAAHAGLKSVDLSGAVNVGPTARATATTCRPAR